MIPFIQTRILPSASAPPSNGSSGLWRRKSSIGAVDAQGLGLTHPMTWIDERLFGWSRSSKHGTSAWSGPIDDISRIHTPDDSDEEDTGDYDNVVGLVAGDNDGSVNPPSRNSRSRQGSYADLQRLRMAPMTSTASQPSATPTEGNEHLTHRTLCDGVSVTRLAAIDRQDTFGHATDDINEEIDGKTR